MRIRFVSTPLALALFGLPAVSQAASPPAPPDPTTLARAADKVLNEENKERSTREAAKLDDLPFLRRLTIDLTGRIPTEDEIQRFMAWPASERRVKLLEELLARDSFADRWAIFFGDLVRVRSGADGGAALQAFIHEAVRVNMPYDELTRRLISASGKAGLQPETGFVLNDEADPMALTGVVSQVFLGVRISCAQCHDHPFDVWTREEFYDMAAFFGKTRRVEQQVKMRRIGVYLQETPQNVIQWPPEDKAKGKPRTAVTPSFPFKLDEADGPNQHIARLKSLRAAQLAEAKAKAAAKANATAVDDILDGAATKTTTKKPGELDVATEAKNAARDLDVLGDVYKASELRRKLGEHVTDPRNRFYSRAIVNRVWAELIGRGFVNPVDDFRNDNPPSHVKTLDYLADEFVASGYDFRFLVKAIVQTTPYQRGHLPGTLSAPDRLAAEKAFTAAPARRMVSETLFDSIVQAGHLFAPKHRPGENVVVITNYVRVPVGVKNDPKKPAATPLPGSGGTAMAGAMPIGGYDLERGIEVDFKSALKKKDGLDVEAMMAVSNEELEAQQMMRNGPAGQRMKYVTQEVKTQIDDNPQFNSSMKMAAPAPAGHFLRVFGQTDRGTLDERRDHSPSMRQALMMLNGKLTNEAARVGPLEPVYSLLDGKTANIDNAVKLVYREILTREPSAEELTDAKAIISDGKTPLDGMADLRWALFNSNEFRFIP